MERYTADVIDVNENGAGIVRLDGMVVFVPGVLSGERVEFIVTERKKNYAIGECLSVIRQSEHRISSQCPDEAACGGCSLGWMDFSEENRVKANAVRAAFRRAGLGSVPVEEAVSAAERYGYRNKVTFHFDAETGRFGTCRPETNEVLPFHGCALCPPLFSEIVLFLNGSPDLTKPLSPVSLAVRSASDGVTVSLAAGVWDEAAADTFRNSLIKRFPAIVRVLVNAPDHRETAELADRVAGLEMRYSAEAFRQVNTAAFEKLLALVREEAGQTDFRSAADLYCGSGVIGLTLAKAFPAAKFYGIEIDPDAVRDAKKNAARNGIGNIRFYCGDAASFRQRFPASVDLVTVDPPRAGLSPAMRRELLALSPKTLIYVSCNPQTLARDLAELTRNGYQNRRVTPVNMFPATKHVETVCCLYHQKKDFISVLYEPKNADYLQQLK